MDDQIKQLKADLDYLMEGDYEWGKDQYDRIRTFLEAQRGFWDIFKLFDAELIQKVKGFLEGVQVVDKGETVQVVFELKKPGA